MNKLVRSILLLACWAALSLVLVSCTNSGAPALVMAPPGPPDMGPATGLSTPPSNAVVFDLTYRAQTGAASDIQYHSYWGFGGSIAETKTNSFLQEVRKRASRLHYDKNPSFRGREWAAVEHDGRKASALYFDLNADGQLSDNERISPTRKTDSGLEFITPDFINSLEDGGHTFCRALLQVNFYGGNTEPNCMWGPASLLEGSSTLNGQSARLLLYADRPGGEFDRFGSSDYSLMPERSYGQNEQYLPRETLSSLIFSEGEFYHLTIEGRRSNGLPARAVLVKDASPTGTLALKPAGSNEIQATVTSLYLHGVDDKTVFLRVDTTRSNSVSLPVGTYALKSGTVSYAASNSPGWEVSFTEGPCGTVKAGEALELALGQPALKVRAIEERHRYNRDQPGSVTFKKGTRIYLEPTIVGAGQEVFSRFRQATAARQEKADRPPKVTITGPNGKQLLSQTMEYG